jgi:general secretion pathway protein F
MRYRVRVIGPHAEVDTLEVSAASRTQAGELVRGQGYTVLAVESPGLSWRQPLSYQFPLQIFCQELNTLLSAGLSLVESLEALAEKEGNGQSRKMLRGLLENLRQGQPFSRALEKYPQHFPELYVSMIRASEHTGELPLALSRYIAYWEQTDKVRSKIVSSSIYPAVIAIVGVTVALFLLFYVVPRFARIYDDIHGEIPALSRLLLQWGGFVDEHGWLVLGTVALLLSGLVLTAMLPDSRARLLRQLLRIPALREHSRVYQIARLYRTLGMLLRGGIPIMQSMKMASGLLDAELRPLLAAAAGRVREGQTLSVAMEEFGLTTPVALRLLRVGERTGHMGEMMDRIATFHDEELARWIDWFTRLFEPILMTLIGVLIGGVVILMYMPIFELAGSIQ